MSYKVLQLSPLEHPRHAREDIDRGSMEQPAY